MVKKRTCVFISGKGSNLKNLILRSRDSNFPVNIKLIVSNNKNAIGIMHAKINSIPYIIIDKNLRNHEDYLLQVLKNRNISLLQLDIEGYEKQALLGGMDLIKRCAPILLLENPLPDTIWLEKHIFSLGYSVTGVVQGNSILQNLRKY